MAGFTRELLEKNWKIMEAFRDGADIQIKSLSGEWLDVKRPAFTENYEYRIKLIEHVNIDWNKIDPVYEWCARDLNGDVCAFVSKPRIVLPYNEWISDDPLYHFVNNYPVYLFETDSWEKDLQKRPD